MKFAYYPGCSLKGTGIPYEKSLLSLFAHLGIELVEIPDWNCCGATYYMSIDEMKALLMTSRNIALAQKMGADIVAPCSACYLNLVKTIHILDEQGEQGNKICEALEKAKIELDIERLPEIKHPLQVLVDQYGVQRIADRANRRIDHLQIVPYYGCLIVRPYAEFDHAAYPTKMDFLFESLGAHVVADYPLKTRCCGGTLTGTIEQIGLELNSVLLREATRRGGNVIATICPLCQFNLEMFQKSIAKQYGKRYDMPILYFTQVVGMALGLADADLGLDKLVYRPEMSGVKSYEKQV